MNIKKQMYIMRTTFKCKKCGEIDSITYQDKDNNVVVPQCINCGKVNEPQNKNTINDDLVKDWLDKFDGNSEITLLSEIANNNICVSGMIDSILAYHVGEVEIAEDFYKRMWRSQ